MAEKSTIARPYAQAAFDLAQQAGELKQWSEMLQFAASVATDKQMSSLFDSPRLTQDELVELFFSVCEGQLNAAGQNFIRVLADNKRLNVLPEIAAMYEKHRAEAEKRVDAEVISAFPLSTALQQQITDALKNRLGREVSLVTRIDESLIGGAIIRAGDLVFDASVSGQLDKLTHALAH
ncbi:MAG: F0F1 ATP synthase subunit delta [Gammaproteobacteria bacterium]